MSAVQVQRLTIISVMLLMVIGAVPAGAEIRDHGPDGEYFYDTVNGLYWFDPGHFHDQARTTVDNLTNYSTIWSWATQAEVNGLLNQFSEAGSDLEDAMGPRRSTIGNGGPRWLGYYFASGIDGQILQSENTPDFTEITAASPQANAAAFGAGAWLVAATDPLTTTAVLENDGIYFHDTMTNLYWYDPMEFESFTRTDVVGWMVSNPDWRWATEAEVFGLLGKRTVDGGPLEDVLGDRSFTHTNGGPRWIGFFNEDGIVNGLLLQADMLPGYVVMNTGSTQANAGAFNAGAWLVSDVDPTPNEDASWGDVKQIYR